MRIGIRDVDAQLLAVEQFMISTFAGEDGYGVCGIPNQRNISR
jgi:hypothetical protein